MIWIEMPVRDTKGYQIGTARVRPNGEIEMTIITKAFVKEMISLLVSDMAKGLILDVDILPAEEMIK